jgi:hypothetical protein
LYDTVRVLSEIQKIDLELDVIEREKERCRLEIEDSESEGDEVKGKITLLGEELITMEAEATDLEEKLRINRDTITKDQERLGEIKNDKQFKAITKEISNAEKAVKLLEMESTALSEKTAGKREEISALEAKCTEKSDTAGALTEQLKAKNDEWSKEIEIKSAEREALVSTIPSNILKKYDTIRARCAGIGIVTVEKETCQGCFIQIPPQFYIQLRRGTEEIINCPHCYRFLYFDGESGDSASPGANDATSEVTPESATETEKNDTSAPADEA